MANNATIVAASLNDQELLNGINKLVQQVDNGTKQMAQSMDTAVDRMKKKLAELGNVNVDFGGSADGGSSRRAKKQQEETAAIKETTAAYKEQKATLDQQASAMQRASQPKSARESYYAFFQGFKEQAKQLEPLIANFERNLSTAISNRVSQLSTQISAHKLKIQELNQEINKNYAVGNTQGVNQAQAALEREIQTVKSLETELKNVNNEFTVQKLTLASMYAEHHRLRNMLAEEAVAEKETSTATQQHLTEEQRITAEIKRRADEIRNSKTWQEKGHLTVGDVNYYDPERANMSKRDKSQLLSLEQQIANEMQKQAEISAKQSVADKQKEESAVRYYRTTKEAIEHAQRYLSSANKTTDGFFIGSFYDSSSSSLRASSMVNKYLYAENDERAKGLSLEQQLQRIYEEHEAAEKRLLEQRQKLNSERTKGNEELSASFRGKLANVLGVNKDEISSDGGSIKAHITYVKQLQEAYNKLSASGRVSSFGKELKEELDLAQRGLQKLQATAARPISLNFIKDNYAEKTLDDIAFKIKQLRSYKMGIDITKTNAANEIKDVDAEINRLEKDMRKYMGTGKSIIEQNNALSRSWNYMKNRLAFYFTVGAAKSFIDNLIEVRSQYEMNERALGILIGSAERGTQIFQELSQMSLVSPYTLIELSTAAKQLTAYDVAARDVVDTTRRLADMASAVGIPIERLTYALGQIKAYGYLNSRDARMFSNAGIPLVKELAGYYTELEGRLVSTADVYDRMKKKTIDYNDVMQVMYKMTDEGGKFFDFQAKMADTLKVRLANLALAWNNMLNDIGRSEQGAITWTIGALRDVFLKWKDIAATIRNVAIAFGVLKLAQVSYVMWSQKVGFATAFADVTSKKFVGTMYALRSGMTKLITTPLTWWAVLAMAVVSAGAAIYDANKKLTEFNRNLSEGAKDNFKNISEFLKEYESIRKSLYGDLEGNIKRTDGSQESLYAHTSIDKDEGNKAWEAMREQIELTSAASEKYVSQLLKIDNISERLRQGFALLNDIQSVNAAIKDMSDSTIDIDQEYSAWWNAYLAPDGLVENIKDVTRHLDEEKTSAEDLRKTSTGLSLAVNTLGISMLAASLNTKSYAEDLKRLYENVKETAASINNFISGQGWQGNPTKINEAFSQITNKIVLDNGLDSEQAFTLQWMMEEQKTAAMKQALKIRIADETAALAQARDENLKDDLNASIKRNQMELDFFNNYTARQRVEWDRFTKWMGEQHRSEMQAMFGNMTAEQIAALDFQGGYYRKWVDDMCAKYAKSHGMAIEDVNRMLVNFVTNANRMSIFIPVTLGINQEAKSYYDTLTSWDTKADTYYNTRKRLQEEINRLEKEGKKNTEEYAKATRESAKADELYNDAVAHGGKSKAADADAKRGAAAARRGAAAATRAQRQAESELQKALKEELSLLDKIRSTYKSLTKEGVDSQTAIAESTKGYDATVGEINKTLAKYGVTALDIKKFAGITNPNELMKMLQSQLDTLQKSGKLKKGEIKDLQVKLKDVNIEAITFNQKKITDSLNNELSKLSDEYELAVSLDADPELGSTFAEMFGINIETLPRTVEEYAAEATKYINKFLKEKNAGIELPNLLNVTNDDLRAFEEMVKSEKLNEEVYKTIEKAIDDVRAKRKKDMEETSKGWNSLIEKYGGLQSKLVKIYKESVVEQVNVAKKFGTAEEKAAVIDIADMIRISEDPVEIARLQVELAKLMQTIKERNPKAFEMEVSIANMEKNKVAKAFWDDFKNSDLYTTTFEDMSNNSVRAIELIIDKMEELKDKVKEDPASMKALMKQLTDAEKELANKDPFKGFILGIKYIHDGAREVVAAREKLANANAEVTSAQDGIGEAHKSGDIRKIIAARDRLSAAIAKQKQAEVDLAQAESKGKKGQNMLTASLSALSAQLDTVSNAFSGVASLFKAAGLDEEADAIEAINEGFSVMATVIELVSAAMAIAQAENPWLLAAAAALSVIVGLVSFLAGSSNKKITEQVEASERAVKRLEIAYVDLQHAIDNAYGTSTVGAKRALAAAKELELAELKRQLRLEKSRKEKDRDEDKILDLQKEIRELMYEITDSIREITDDLLGSDVGGFAENLVSSMIDAFKQGEDYMKVFEDSFDKMVDNLIMKSIVSRVVASYLDKLWSDLDNRIESRSRKEADAYAKAVEANALTAGLTDDEIRKIVANEKYNYMYGLNYSALDKVTQEDIDAYRKTMQDTVKTAKAELDAVSAITDEDILSVIEQINQIKPELGEQLKAIFGQWYKFGQDSDKTLSNLQQGIQGITEDTAGALEAYLNIVSQRVFEQTDYIREIRDCVLTFDMDVQLGTLSQMLLQLQQSYAVQLAIQGILNGVLNPSGNAFTVELR